MPEHDRSNIIGLESARLVLSRASWYDTDRCVAHNGLRLLRDFLAHDEDLSDKLYPKVDFPNPGAWASRAP